MIGFEWLLSAIICTQLAHGNPYGDRMRTQALANSNIDGRIAAILNSARVFPQHIPNFDRRIGRTTSSNIHNKHTWQKYGLDSPEEDSQQMPVIEVNPSDMPVSIVFKTTSPNVDVLQQHNSDPVPEPESTRTDEEPHRISHEVYRPVIQELTDVIQPYRKHVQQIEPVIEVVERIRSIAKRSPIQSNRFSNYHTKSKAKHALATNRPHMRPRTHNRRPNVAKNMPVPSMSPEWIKPTLRRMKDFKLSEQSFPRFRLVDNSISIINQKKLQDKLPRRNKNGYLNIGGALSGLKTEGTYTINDLKRTKNMLIMDRR